MKNFLVFALCSFLCFASCTEIQNEIEVINDIPDTGLQQKNVLLEKYTGVGCSNCPSVTLAVKGLKNQHGSRLIPVFVHTTNFADPLSGGVSNQDLGSNTIDDFVSFVGEVNSVPSGAIDRVLFNGENDVFVGQSSFAANVLERLEEDLLVEIDIETAFDSSTRIATTKVDLNPLSNVELEDLVLMVVLVEDSIIETQNVSGDLVTDYEHNHVLRDFFTPTVGVEVEQLSAGELVTKEFSLEIPDHMVAENCRVIGFLGRNGASKDVLQVNEADLVE